MTAGFYPVADNATSREIARAIRMLSQGGINCTGTVTLSAGVTTTTLTDARLTANSHISFMPTTANAAGALTNLYVSARTKGSCTLTHSNTATLDRTFVYAIIG